MAGIALISIDNIGKDLGLYQNKTLKAGSCI